MSPHEAINQTGGDVEYYTPEPIIDAARLAMGAIDLDVSSCEVANRRVRATEYFTREQDGLFQTWYGRVWMNHPFMRGENSKWIRKLLSEWRAGHLTSACCITYAATSEAWFRPLLDFPQCFLTPRTNYLKPDGRIKTGVTKGSVVTYLGPELNWFVSAFRPLGVVKILAG